MADIVLLDANGTSATYQNVDSITVPRSGGGTATFTAGGGGGTKPAYLLNNGDTVATLYFNVDYDVGAILPYLTYDQTETITGAGLSYCYLGVGHLSAFDLTNLGLSGEYAVAWADEAAGTVVPIYATTAVPAFGVTDAGWQVASYTPSSSITVDYTYINPRFFTVMDEIVAQDDIAFGDHGGGGSVEEDAVTFYDYDGSVVTSYSATDFANLTELPANPTHTGLTAQGWNWSMANAKTYVASYGRLNIGQMYTTSDGKTRIYIHLEDGRLDPYLGIAINGTATVEWGDETSSTVTGSSTSTVVNTQHTYSAAGDYVIAIAVTGSMALVGGSSYGTQVLWKNSTTKGLNGVYQNAIQKAEIGSNTSIGSYAFSQCYSLATVTIPSTVTSIDSNAFANCYSLATVTIPSTVTSIDSNAFANCYSLTTVTIPSSVTSIGSYAFSQCYALASVTFPSTMTRIGNVFSQCYALATVTIPSSVTSIGNAFASSYSLATVTIPSTVTSIGSNAFSQCYSLATVTIPSSVTSIGSYAFKNCYGLGMIKFLGSTPPTVADSNAWTNLPTDCKIYVPSAVLSTYKGKANYPNSSTYTYVGY